MTSSKEPDNPYAAVLADLRAKRDEIDNTIKVLEGVSGMFLPLSTSTKVAIGYSNSTPGEVEQGSTLDEGAFHGMSIVDATMKLLAIRQRKMGNPEIAKELAAGGLVMNSADPVNTVGSVLTRRFNKVGDVVKVARGTWGLKEWYPNRTFKTSSTRLSAEQIQANLESLANKEAADTTTRMIGGRSDEELDYDL